MNKKFKSKLIAGMIVTNLLYLVIVATQYFYISNIENLIKVNKVVDMTFYITVATVLISIALGYYLIDKLCQPIGRLKDVMKKITQGDLDARAGINSNDEFQEIGTSIDTMLKERVSVLTTIEDENEQLNDSIVALLETVSQLAQKNLAIKSRVNEDITGPLADALNLMTSETTSVLNEVTRISGDVAETSTLVKSQSDNVLLLANKERDEAEMAAKEL